MTKQESVGILQSDLGVARLLKLAMIESISEFKEVSSSEAAMRLTKLERKVNLRPCSNANLCVCCQSPVQSCSRPTK
jgi:hypothetical protein